MSLRALARRASPHATLYSAYESGRVFLVCVFTGRIVTAAGWRSETVSSARPSDPVVVSEGRAVCRPRIGGGVSRPALAHAGGAGVPRWTPAIANQVPRACPHCSTGHTLLGRALAARRSVFRHSPWHDRHRPQRLRRSGPRTLAAVRCSARRRLGRRGRGAAPGATARFGSGGRTPPSISSSTPPCSIGRRRSGHIGSRSPAEWCRSCQFCENLAVFKAFFSRTNCWADLEEMVATRLPGPRAPPVGVIARYLGPEDEPRRSPPHAWGRGGAGRRLRPAPNERGHRLRLGQTRDGWPPPATIRVFMEEPCGDADCKVKDPPWAGGRRRT